MRIGFSKRDITPAVGTMLAGNGDYVSEALHDALFARAVVIESEGRRVALVSCDLLGIEREFAGDVKRALCLRDPKAFDSVLICCTHTHNGPPTRFNRIAHLKHRDDAYLARLANAVTEAILEAAGDLREARMIYGQGLANENFNRRLITPDGVAHFYTPRVLQANPELEALTGGGTDPELDALQFVDSEGKPLLTLVHYAAHPLTIGLHANVISRDYCGRLVDLLEEAYDAPAMFIQGACGDLHNKGLFAGFERMEAMATALAMEARRILDANRDRVENPGMRVETRQIALEVDPIRRETGLWNPAVFQDSYRVKMEAFSLGPIAFVSIPGELCCQPGMQIKANAPFSQTWLLYNCNAYASYLLQPRGYLEGGYEYDTNCFRPSACQLVVQTAVELTCAIADASVDELYPWGSTNFPRQ